MTDKLTDKDVIKALPNMTYGGHYCAKCKYDNGKGNDRCGLKGCKIARYALDLITCQQAEYENLKVENQSLRTAGNSLKMHYEEAQAEIERLNKVYQANQQLINALNKSYFLAKTEAFKEFAERLCEDRVSNDPVVIAAKCLLKEMVGENND